jgi:hypothetical protein
MHDHGQEENARNLKLFFEPALFKALYIIKIACRKQGRSVFFGLQSPGIVEKL